MKAYVVSTSYDMSYDKYEQIIKDYPFIKKYNYKAIPATFTWYGGRQTNYNKHQIELNDITDFCSFINDCLKAGKEVIVKRENDDDLYFTFEIYDDYRE